MCVCVHVCACGCECACVLWVQEQKLRFPANAVLRQHKPNLSVSTPDMMSLFPSLKGVSSACNV